jgi:hypothetical protein
VSSRPQKKPVHLNSRKDKLLKKPITNCTPREVAPIDPNLSVPSEEQSDTEAHSLFQVIEALERDKTADQETLKNYVPRT